MPLFRGSKNATIVNGEIVATAQDIADAVNDAIAAKNAAEAAEAAALSTLDDFDDRYLGAKSSDPSTDNDGDALIDGALYYNTDTNITRVYDVSSSQWFNVKPTATEQTNINTVAGIAVDVETVADISSDVTTAAGISSDISSVSGVSTDVTTVAGIASDVTSVASDEADIGTVASSISDVTTTADNISSVNTVASDLNETVSEIDTVATNITNVNSVGQSIGDVNTVSDNTTEIQAVASDLGGGGFDYNLGSITDTTIGPTGNADGFIITVADNIDDVQTIAADISSLNTVAGISTEITAVADDEQDIGDVASKINSVDVIASDLAGAGFDYDLGSITGVTEGVIGTPDGYIITVFNIRDDVQSVAAIDADVSSVAAIDTDVTTVAANVSDVTNFADVYIGPASSDPSTRSDGSALQNGDLYFNTTDDRLKVYDGSQWEVTARDDSDIRNLLSAAGDLAYDSATGQFSFTERTDAEVRALLSAAGDLSYNATTGEFSVTTYKSSDFDTDFSGKNTSDLTEGDNLYYTGARVNDDIDARVDKTFVDALSVDSDTLDGQEGTYYLDRANHTGTQTLSTISDSGALAALDEVETAQIANQAVTDDKLATSLDLGSI